MTEFFYLCAFVLPFAFVAGVIEVVRNRKRAEVERGWRVGHSGRDQMYYEERINRTWHRILIDGELLMGRAHHVIYFYSEQKWREYPDWARERRGEIIARIKSDFREPDYEYHGA